MSHSKNQPKKRIAVFFGGRSPEHDVSVVSGLQVMQALDSTLYDAFPVYIAPGGEWLVGDVLREKNNYLLDVANRAKTTEVTLDVTANRIGRLVPRKSGMFGGSKAIEFDVALPVFHGLYGEDGNVQGLFELIGVPYTGMRTMASSILMDKATTKKILHALDIPYLPYAVLKRPDKGYMIAREELEKLSKGVGFPCIVKPSHLGSSIGVGKANNLDEIAACLPAIFEFDDAAIIEPFVQNLVEYNLAVSKISGRTVTSAIERPKTTDELLDFKQKYLAGGGSKSGTKTPGQSSEGMLSLTRELNPKLDPKSEENIRAWGVKLFDAIDGAGAPRIDFIGNAKSGEIWLNEVNPCPGSYGYFLWEAAKTPLLFTEFLSALIEEAFAERRKKNLPADPVPKEARLFKRKT